MRYKKIKSILKWILVLNWFVAFLKIFVGLLTGTVSILSDGVHSFFDGATNIIGLIGIKLAERPADKDHPYGHQKYEAVASQVIVLFLALAVYGVLGNAIGKLLNPPEAIYINWLVFVVLGISIIIDGFVAWYEHKKGVELESHILKSDARHTQSHYITTGATILGAILIKLGFLPIVDPIIAILVVGFIIKLGYSIFKDSTGILSDKALVKEEMIKQITEDLNEVKSCHSVRTRGDETHIFLDFHLTFSRDITLGQAHKICDELEEKIKAAIPEIQDITIHIEPD